MRDLSQKELADIKDLSVNRSNLPPTDDGSGEMNERFVTLDEFLIPDKELPNLKEWTRAGIGRTLVPTASVFKGTFLAL